MHTDVVIIGGGIAGLVTALHCIHAGYRVVILEKNNRFGGRIHTIFHKKWMYEAGAGRIHTSHERTLALLRTFGMTLEKISKNKSFRDVQCEKSTPSPNVTEDLIKKVIHKSRNMPRDILQQMTFGMLCQQVLGPHQTNKLESAFGYDAEFEHINAWDGLEMFRHDFLTNGQHAFYHCVEGLSVWVDRIVSYIQSSNMASLLSGYNAYKWKQTSNHFVSVSARNANGIAITMTAKAIVCAIPKKDLIETFVWSPYQQSLLESVQEIPLHRIYGKFPLQKSKSWFANIPVTTTNANIRQFIPIDTHQGIAMMSYTDSNKADLWQTYAEMGENTLRSALLQQLHVVFPEVRNIPKPTWVQSHYWNAGVHMWKPGVDSTKVSTEIIQPYGTDTPFFLVGESYSRHQAWIEGALETVDDALPKIIRVLQIHKGGASIMEWVKRKGKRVTYQDLEQMKQLFPNEYWVILENRVIRVTEWMNLHPGGRYPFTQNIYKDITSQFRNIGSHKNPDGTTLKKHVMRMIQKYTIATII